jgi:hypothetical protein
VAISPSISGQSVGSRIEKSPSRNATIADKIIRDRNSAEFCPLTRPFRSRGDPSTREPAADDDVIGSYGVIVQASFRGQMMYWRAVKWKMETARGKGQIPLESPETRGSRPGTPDRVNENLIFNRSPHPRSWSMPPIRALEEARSGGEAHFAPPANSWIRVWFPDQ